MVYVYMYVCVICVYGPYVDVIMHAAVFDSLGKILWIIYKNDLIYNIENVMNSYNYFY